MDYAQAHEEYLDQVVRSTLRHLINWFTPLYGLISIQRSQQATQGWSRDFILSNGVICILALTLIGLSLQQDWKNLRSGAIHGSVTAVLLALGAAMNFSLGLQDDFTNIIVLIMIGNGVVMLCRTSTPLTIVAIGIVWAVPTYARHNALLLKDAPPLVAAGTLSIFLLRYRRKIFEKQFSIVDSQRKQNELLSQSFKETEENQKEFERRVGQRARARATTIEQLKEELEEKARLEKLLNKVRDDDPLGRLASGVAHDLSNYLNVVTLNLEELQERHAPDTRLGGSLEQGARTTEEILTLIEQLRAYSRKQTLSRSVVEADTLLRDFTYGLGALLPENVTVKCRLDAPDVRLLVDIPQLNQALVNLCLNAGEAMSEGGVLTLSSESDENQVHLIIEDTGEGMSRDTLAKAREPYFTRRGFHAGRGLGLSVVDGILAQHRGRLELSSHEGHGSRAVLSLPLFKPEACSSSRILLADVDCVSRSLLANFLERCGYQVLEVENAEQAREAFFASQPHPGILVTELVLESQNGIQLAESLSALFPGLKTIIMGESERKLDRARLSSNTWYLPKPFGLTELRELVEA